MEQDEEGAAADLKARAKPESAPLDAIEDRPAEAGDLAKAVTGDLRGSDRVGERR